MAGGEAAVRGAFDQQAEWCRTLGSPFTALLCDTLGERLDRGSAFGRAVLDWSGDPGGHGDVLPLRVAGGLHALVRRGDAPALARHYPPAPLPDPPVLWAGLDEILRSRSQDLLPWLGSAPQTNEVGRSALVMAGLAVLADRFGLPFALFELGASAGLNLLPDRYAVSLDGRPFGDPSSPLRLEPRWQGAPPPAAAVRIASRRGVDLNPLDVTVSGDRERLMAYVWPDQAERLARTAQALDIAAADPPALDRADAADWLDSVRPDEAQPGHCRVVMHTIAFQYFPDGTKARIRQHLAALGEAARAEAPLAWLRFEASPAGGKPELRLTVWPGSGEQLLALAGPHGHDVHWFGASLR